MTSTFSSTEPFSSTQKYKKIYQKVLVIIQWVITRGFCLGDHCIGRNGNLPGSRKIEPLCHHLSSLLAKIFDSSTLRSCLVVL